MTEPSNISTALTIYAASTRDPIPGSTNGHGHGHGHGDERTTSLLTQPKLDPAQGKIDSTPPRIRRYQLLAGLSNRLPIHLSTFFQASLNPPICSSQSSLLHSFISIGDADFVKGNVSCLPGDLVQVLDARPQLFEFNVYSTTSSPQPSNRTRQPSSATVYSCGLSFLTSQEFISSNEGNTEQK